MKTSLHVLAALLTGAAFLNAQTYPGWEDEWQDFPHYEEGYDSPESPGAITDGNPQSTTAILAAETAEGTAFLSPDSVLDGFDEPIVGPAPGESSPASVTSNASANTSNQDASIDVDVGFGTSTIGGIDVDMYTLRIPYSRKLSDRGTLNFKLPVSISRVKDIVLQPDGVNFGDASIYGGGLNLGYTHKVFMKSDDKPFRWNVTPSAGFFLRESSDLNQGSWVYNLGLSSSFAYRLNQNWIINFGNSISLAWNSGRKDYPDPMRDDQQVLINGIQLFYLAGRWTHFGYVVDTRFLRDSFIDNYQSYALGTGYRITRKRSVKFTLIYEDGNDYESFRATVGTSWKF